jgi:hypothetical protein
MAIYSTVKNYKTLIIMKPTSTTLKLIITKL